MPQTKPVVARTLAQAGPVRAIRHALEAAVALIVASYAAIICLQVFYRFALNQSLVWSEELVRYGLLWGVMLGAALASDRQAHVALEPLRGALTPERYRLVQWLSGACVIVFCAVTAWYGADYLYRLRLMSSPASQIPMPYVFAAIPTGMVLVIFFTLVHLISGTPPHDPLEEETAA